MSNGCAATKFDVLVVGAGPAGMAAAARAAECGVRVGIVDDNFSPWRTDLARRQLEGQESAGGARGSIVCGPRRSDSSLWDASLSSARSRVYCWRRGRDDIRELRYEKLILATGARERFLPFPGWTLPNVMGAGGLQAMVKCGLADSRETRGGRRHRAAVAGGRGLSCASTAPKFR